MAFTAYASTDDEAGVLRMSENLTLEDLEEIPWRHLKEKDSIHVCLSYWYGDSQKQAGRFDEAYKVYVRLRGYRDVDSILENDEDIVAVAEALRAPYKEIGNYIKYGHFEQDNNTENGTEAIEWKVLDVQGENVLLLSRYGLDVKTYNEEKTDITWEDCTLRKWLNGTFFQEAFTEEEQKGIPETEIDNSQEQGYKEWNDIPGGNNTRDRVFLLSCREANQYLDITWENEKNIVSRAAPTVYALAKGAWVYSDYRSANGKKAGLWWLRSPGSASSRAAYVSIDGSLGASAVTCSTATVRPALWLNLDAVIF